MKLKPLVKAEKDIFFHPLADGYTPTPFNYKIAAIIAYRSRTGVGVAEAKNVVESYIKDIYTAARNMGLTRR